MAIDSAAKRRSVTNIVTRMGLGVLNASGINDEDRANTSFIYGFLDYEVMNTVPTENVMVLHPIQPTAQSNIALYQQDSREWQPVQKSETSWRSEITALRFRIMTKASMTAFYNFHNDNFNEQVMINFPGVQPFIRTGSEHCVRILPFGAPKQISPNVYEITIPYRNILRTTTTIFNLILEDASGSVELEDGSGTIILEESP